MHFRARAASLIIVFGGLCGSACSGPSLSTAASEAGCASCAVLAEADMPLLELHSHDDSLFVLDEAGAIFALPKAGGELRGLVAHGSNAEHFGVTATDVAWVSLVDPSDRNLSQVHALGRELLARPELPAFQGPPLLAVGLGEGFVAAFLNGTSGSEVVRETLQNGETSRPAETLSDEEQSELPTIAGSDAEVVWCRAHADQSSSLWRLTGTSDPTRADYPFSCSDLWTSGNGDVFVLDPSSGMNCYHRIDANGQDQLLTCTDHLYTNLTPLPSGSIAFIDGGTAVRSMTLDGQVSTLFSAGQLIGIQNDGDLLYYATAVHVGSFPLKTAR
jgi:hypothetical protein